MRIHSDKLTGQDIYRATADEHIAGDVYPVTFATFGSRTRQRAYEVQLGTEDKTSGPTKSRHYKNSGTHGADSVWAATYDEWGWFLANLFAIDPDAIAGPYKGVHSFRAQTDSKYVR